MADDPFLDSTVPLTPSDAVAALIVDEAGRYLMQLRDRKRAIFYPGHWGCFGGAVEAGESADDALARELDEELALALPAGAVRYFTNFDLDFGFAGCGVLCRRYYEVRIASAALDGLSLGEGRAMRFFTGAAILSDQRVVPYDAFALWMHYHRARIRC